MVINPRCRMLIQQIVDGFRSKASNPNLDKAQVIADMTKSLVDLSDRPGLRESVPSVYWWISG